MTTEAPFALQRLDHLVLRTSDVERLVKFYVELGCAVVRKVESINLIQLAAGVSMIDIVGVDEARAERGRNLDHFALWIEPYDEARILEFCAARGIEVQTMAHPLLGADGFGPAVYIRDPDGNRVELKGPPERPRPQPEVL